MSLVSFCKFRTSYDTCPLVRIKELCFLAEACKILLPFLLLQVCDSADLQANDEGSPSLINRRPSLVGTLSDEELESLKILSGGIAVMMVCACNQHIMINALATQFKTQTANSPLQSAEFAHSPKCLSPLLKVHPQLLLH